MSSVSSHPAPIRLAVQQPALPRYRVPVFRALAQRPGLELTLYYGDVPGLPNAAPDGFRAVHIPLHRKKVGHRVAMWHPPQWDLASGEAVDVLCLSWDLHYASLVPSLLRARALGLPTILWGHGYSKSESTLRSHLRRKVTDLATAILFYNRTAADAFVRQGVDSTRIFVAPNALDQSPIQAARADWCREPARLAAFRQKNRLDERPMILFVSRLEPGNRVDLLVQAAAALGPGVQVAIIGKGPDQPRLTALAGSLGIADRVRFGGAIYDEHELAPWFLCSDVFCYPENIGLSVLHAFGYGLPVVTSDRLESQNPEIEALRHDHNGLLYKHGDLGSLTTCLRLLLQDQPRRQRMSAAALETVRGPFSLGTMITGFEQAIHFSATSANRRACS